MVTKCDLVDGFAEYFEDLTRGRPRAGLGRDLPLRADASPTRAPQAFPGGVRRADDAAERAGVRARRGGARRPGAAPRCSRFPQQMATLRERAHAVRDRRLRARASSPARSCCAACTSPAARRTARRSIGCSAASAARFGARTRSCRRRDRARRTSSRRLLKDVMIGESGLAGINRRLETAEGRGAARRLRRRRA